MCQPSAGTTYSPVFTSLLTIKLKLHPNQKKHHGHGAAKVYTRFQRPLFLPSSPWYNKPSPKTLRSMANAVSIPHLGPDRSVSWAWLNTPSFLHSLGHVLSQGSMMRAFQRASPLIRTPRPALPCPTAPSRGPFVPVGPGTMTCH